ncbi:MAG: response regulator [Comamonadaceae bacterium]|nr:response regulator [Comamonadaceae bacterium]
MKREARGDSEGREVLVVDDERGIRATFDIFLRHEGYEVATAENYEEAMALISETVFDVILADLILEGESRDRASSGDRDRQLKCPVVMITGCASDDGEAEAANLGAFAYLTKPVVRETALHITRQALDRGRSRGVGNAP